MNNQRSLTTKASHVNDYILLADDLLEELKEDMCFVELCHDVVLAYDPEQQNGGEMILWLLMYDPVEGLYKLSQRLEVSHEYDLQHLCLCTELLQDAGTVAKNRQHMSEALQVLPAADTNGQSGSHQMLTTRISWVSTHGELFQEQPAKEA
jgi:hypothetical protein